MIRVNRIEKRGKKCTKQKTQDKKNTDLLTETRKKSIAQRKLLDIMETNKIKRILGEIKKDPKTKQKERKYGINKYMSK